MASLNKVLLIGNLTRDPEVRYTPKGTAVAQLGLAINRVYRTATGEEKEDVCFVDVDVFARQAEAAGQYLSKGSPLFVEGQLRLDQWDDKKTGEKRSRLKVIAERIQFLGRPKNAEYREGTPAGNREPASGAKQTPSEPSDAPVPEDDDIPF